MAKEKEYYSNGFINQANETEEFTDLMLGVIDKSMEKTTVASLGFVAQLNGSVNGCGLAMVNPFPLEKEQKIYSLDVYYNINLDIEVGDIVVILFMDRNFKNNLNFDEPKVVKTEQLHSVNQGVIISILKKHNQQ